MQSENNTTPSVPATNGSAKPNGRVTGKTYRTLKISDPQDVEYIQSLTIGILSEKDVIALLIRTCREQKVKPVQTDTSDIANGAVTVTEPAS